MAYPSGPQALKPHNHSALKTTPYYETIFPTLYQTSWSPNSWNKYRGIIEAFPFPVLCMCAPMMLSVTPFHVSLCDDHAIATPFYFPSASAIYYNLIRQKAQVSQCPDVCGIFSPWSTALGSLQLNSIIKLVTPWEGKDVLYPTIGETKLPHALYLFPIFLGSQSNSCPCVLGPDSPD